MDHHHCPHCGLQIKGFQRISFGNVAIHEPGEIAFNSESLNLPPTQFILVDALIRARGRGISRATLANLVDPDIHEMTIVKYINRARDLFRSHDPEFSQIECLKGYSMYRWQYRSSSISIN